MAVSEEELKELMETPKADIEKITSISSDGRALLTRVPKEIETEFEIKKGDKFRWLIDKEKNNINLDVLKEDGNNKKKESA